MAADLAGLLDDLAAETAVLDGLLAGLDAARWAAPTPSPGWSIHDQVTHLAYFDETAALATCLVSTRQGPWPRPTRTGSAPRPAR
jgi:uncharacterized protein (TIGR03083 family)